MLFYVYAGFKQIDCNYLKWESVPVKHISVGDEIQSNVMTWSEVFYQKKVLNACIIGCILE